MPMNDSQRIPASKEKVWAALNNPDILKQCIPGCRPSNKVMLSDLDPPNSYRISGA
jgi:uncharacterized protein